MIRRRSCTRRRSGGVDERRGVSTRLESIRDARRGDAETVDRIPRRRIPPRGAAPGIEPRGRSGGEDGDDAGHRADAQGVHESVEEQRSGGAARAGGVPVQTRGWGRRDQVRAGARGGGVAESPLRDVGKHVVARQVAGATLNNQMGKHFAAIRIQARFRGILHRLRERRREREEAVESARIAARLLEEKIKAAAGVSAHAGRMNGPEQRGEGTDRDAEPSLSTRETRVS